MGFFPIERLLQPFEQSFCCSNLEFARVGISASLKVLQHQVADAGRNSEVLTGSPTGQTSSEVNV
jgi:hypothetical protein